MKNLFSFVFLFSAAFFSNAQTPCDNGMAGIYPCDNVDLLSHMTASAVGGGEMNDIWGWTDPNSGVEYVLLGREAGTSFIDISDPINPVYVGFLPSHTGNSIWRDIKVYNNHAFIVSEAGNHGMQVFDLTQLAGVTSPPQTFSETAHYNNFGDSHNVAINEESGYAYVVGSNTANGGLHIVDISDPVNPTIAGTFSADGYTHDAQVVNYIGPDADYAGMEIAFACNEDNVAIVNVSDKSDTQFISHASYLGDEYTHQGWLTEDHRYFIANDELDEAFNGVNTTTFIFDVQDLDAPTLIGTYVHSTAAIDHNLYVQDGYVYESNYRAGLRILGTDDISNGNLTQEGFFDLYPSSDAAQFNGTWSNYPYFSSGVVAVSHIEDGLFLLQPDFKTYYLDSDSDGFGDASNSVSALNQPTGYVQDDTDCDDSLANVFPGASGSGEGIDNNCNGTVEGDELAPPCTADFNSDGFRNVDDLTLFLGEFGCVSNCTADANGDGLVTIDDLTALLGVFGSDCD